MVLKTEIITLSGFLQLNWNKSSCFKNTKNEIKNTIIKCLFKVTKSIKHEDSPEEEWNVIQKKNLLNKKITKLLIDVSLNVLLIPTRFSH